MAKKTKKIPDLQLQGFDDIDFNKKPDVQAAQKIIQPMAETPVSTPKSIIEEPTAKAVRVVREEFTSPSPPIVPHRTSPSNARERQPKSERSSVKGTVAPVNKKRASFNIDADLHRALKEYSFFEEIDMVEYIFEELVKLSLIHI